jgi:hypothetical protein
MGIGHQQYSDHRSIINKARLSSPKEMPAAMTKKLLAIHSLITAATNANINPTTPLMIDPVTVHPKILE